MGAADLREPAGERFRGSSGDTGDGTKRRGSQIDRRRKSAMNVRNFAAPSDRVGWALCASPGTSRAARQDEAEVMARIRTFIATALLSVLAALAMTPSPLLAQPAMARQWQVANSDGVQAQKPYELHNTRRPELT